MDRKIEVEPPQTSLGITVRILNDNPTAWANSIDSAFDNEGVGHVDLWMEHLPSLAEVEALRRVLRGRPATAHAPFVEISLVTREKEFADFSLNKLSGFVDICGVLGVSTVALHAGKYPDFDDKSEAFKRLAERYSKLRERAGVIGIGIENLKPKSSGVSRELISSFSDVQTLTELLPDVQLTLDFGHAVQSEIDLNAFTAQFGSAVILVHVHDAIRGGHSHRRLGDGDLNLSAAARAIHQTRVPYATMELLSRKDELDAARMLRPLLAQ